MKNEFDAFERRLSDALQGDEMPRADFVDRVMTQVRETPQEDVSRKPAPKFRAWRLAACAAAVAVVAVPLLFAVTMRAGSAAPEAADCCAPAEAPTEGGAETFSYSMTGEETEPADMKQKAEEDSVNAAANVMQETVTVSDPAVAKEVLAWLTENGYVDDGGYLLSAEEAAALMDAVPQAELPLCTVQLIVEAGE